MNLTNTDLLLDDKDYNWLKLSDDTFYLRKNEVVVVELAYPEIQKIEQVENSTSFKIFYEKDKKSISPEEKTEEVIEAIAEKCKFYKFESQLSIGKVIVDRLLGLLLIPLTWGFGIYWLFYGESLRVNIMVVLFLKAVEYIGPIWYTGIMGGIYLLVLRNLIKNLIKRPILNTWSKL
ncbi:MAG: hypothetical protein KA313_03500 [Pseudarcicella sp.]|nr:hypothetical protein [Pseudarcicella sp.]MBP6410139.1 hypothetical protein [Pseudarcicella sp.]